MQLKEDYKLCIYDINICLHAYIYLYTYIQKYMDIITQKRKCVRIKMEIKLKTKHVSKLYRERESTVEARHSIKVNFNACFD